MAATVEVNGRDYRVPAGPTVVFTVDGGDPAYFDDGLRRGRLPRLAAMLAAGGTYAVGRGHMPSLTNPNNLSLVTGAPPSVHGVPGNHALDPDGREVQVTDPAFLRAPSIHASLRQAGARVLAVTAKEKLRRLLAAGDVPSVSAEHAADQALPAFDLADLPGLVGAPPPGIYDWDLSAYAMQLGLAVHRRVGLDLLYVSLTDFVQHTSAPGDALADRFLERFDALLGEYLDAGFAVGVTADHGMNAKPRVHYLADVLARAGVAEARVVLPITDPYVVHHGALGSFAWLFVRPTDLERARAAVASLEGVEEVYTREEAAVIYQHPADRIGDLSVAADASTALGSSERRHDLSQLRGPLRSHGGRHEQRVPLIVSRPLSARGAALLAGGARNSDLHALLLDAP